ncbi:hypothetical protein D8I30_04020 [Brevundimonas naejangsanensis]|uniref:SGNH/GDSL hydrolase family protein n=1 Tax=Brevundimonas naejangsanensis TaxID=588932 RepID=A0A494RKG3_9CAUL|nr:DUF6270 domain-containing protein [Brevundimonas naejangsanensis]AYG94442.1 hypothetical protein D8I30_04020 [Brevundimonas naejangsanensis]
MKVAIFGSCVTRDAFGFTGRDSDVLTYVARQTIRAAVSPRDNSVELALSHLQPEGFDIRAMLAATRKQSFAMLAASQAEVLLVDLIDERFSTRTDRNSVMTLSTAFPPAACAGWEHWRAVEPRTISATLAAVPRFCDALREAAKGRPIILHRAYWLSGDELSGPMNAALDQYYDAVGDELKCPSITVDESLRLPDPSHKWGPAPYHYTQQYYDYFISQFDMLTA